MNFDDDLPELDDILAAAKALEALDTPQPVAAVLNAMLAGHPPPKRKRSLAEEYCDASDDFCFDEYARRVSTTFRDSTPYALPEAPPEVMPDHGSVPEPDDIFAGEAALDAPQAVTATALDDILAGVEALDAGQPPPRPKRTMNEFCVALDAGRADGFFLDDFDEFDQRQLARFFGLHFRDGSPYAPPEVMPDRGSVPKPDPAPPRVPEPWLPVVQTPAIVEPAAPAPSSPFGGFAPPPIDKLPPFPNVNALFLDLRIAPATPAAEALVEDLVGRLLEAEERRGARQRKRRESAQRQFRDAVSAIAGNLLRAWGEHPPVAVHRSRDVNTFGAEGISWCAFLGAMDAMKCLRLVLHRRGGRSKDKPSGWAARYWPDLHLLRAAAAHGITAANVRDAFRYRPAPKVGKAPKVNEPLRLKAFKNAPRWRR
ncbi:MAG TPA: hypothetical protein VEX11_02850 [Acetobacteraceae bacterium]|nr:hypothetical protein [Acetobacteraceae bacterium]